METEDEICEEGGGLKSPRAGCADTESSTRSQSWSLLPLMRPMAAWTCLVSWVYPLALLGSQWVVEWEMVLRIFAALPEQGRGSERGRYRTCWIIWGDPFPRLDWM